MNRVELQKLAVERIEDARALLDGGRWDFAYYCAGYAVECAIKSCILSRMILTGWVFEEKWKAQECLTHEFAELIRLAGLNFELNAKLAASAAMPMVAGSLPGGPFGTRWGTVLKWSVGSRYQTRSEAEARGLFEAITNDPDGVMLWIQNYW
jgi:hypothetical protein